MMTKVDYIFCINTGRCGSNYLYEIFSRIDDCVAVHEPEPICHRQPMRDFLSGDEAPMRALMPAKVEQIRRSRGMASLYIETNHCFIKGFGWLLPESIAQERIGVIILRRDKEKVVDSYWRIGTTPLTRRGRDWLIGPGRRNPIVPPPQLWFNPRLTLAAMRWLALPYRSKKWYQRLRLNRPPVPKWVEQYEKAGLSWYYDETYALGDQYQRRFPQIRYYPVSIEELNDPARVRDMLDFFGCSYREGIEGVIGKPTNLKRTEMQTGGADDRLP